MSIEDPRLSGFDTNASADEFDAAVEQHLGYVPDNTRHVEVAQATTPDANPDAPKTDRLPVETAAAPVPTEIVPDQNNVVTLPVGVSIDDIKLEGGNLVLVQADGTEIVIVGGAANIPTFVIGEVELPQQALFAALEGSDINVAQGPDGSYSASAGSPSAGGDFDDSPIDNGPEQFALADLLGDTNFGDETPVGQRLGDVADTVPTFGAADAGFVDEDELENGNHNDEGASNFVTGSLGINWGQDDSNAGGNTGLVGGDRGVAFTQATLDALSAQGYTSDGVTLLYAISPDGTTIVAYKPYGDEARMAITAELSEGNPNSTPVFNGEPVFVVSVSDISTSGSYEFTLVGNLDHPDGSTEDDITIRFDFTAQDSDGDRGSSSFTVTVNDDSPVIGSPENTALDEEDLPNGNGNPGDSYEGGSDLADGVDGPLGFDNGSGRAVTGNLGVSWGADDNNTGDKQISLSFVGYEPTTEIVSGEDGEENTVVTTYQTVFVNSEVALTSDGQSVHYFVTEIGGQPALVGFTGSDPSSEKSWVFTVTLDDSVDGGAYQFTLLQPIDHNGSGAEDNLRFDINFKATDSDSDSAEGSFSVTVNDDAPVIYAPEEGPDSGSVAEAVGTDSIVDSTSGSLGIQWGSDNGNSVVDGGFNGTQINGDRSVVFGNDTGEIQELSASDASNFITVTSGETVIALDTLTSNGQSLVFTLSENGTVLTASAGGETVFTVSLSDVGSGSYNFELTGVLDHPVDASDEAGLDDLTFNFTYTSRDGDGDAVTGNFSVDVTDDVPVRGEEVRGTVEDEAVNGGNNEDDGLSAVATGALNINWGADDGDSDLGTVGGPHVDGDRTVEFSTDVVTVSGATGEGLTSLGQQVSTVIVGGVLIGYTGEVEPTSIEDKSVVFHATLSDDGTGSYTFTLVQPLDHASGEGVGTENELSLTFGYTATDADGDTVNGSFTVDVVDDVATIGKPYSGGVVEEEQAAVAGVGNEDTSGTGDADQIGNLDATTQTTGGSLDISWGSDNANGGSADRSVQFANVQDPELTSRGAEIHYTTINIDGQPVLLAYTGANAPTELPANGEAAVAAHVVFSVALSDAGSGSYTFNLYDTLDHASGNGENAIDLTFQFTATDSDGDTTAPATISVKIIDDVPVASGAAVTVTADEDDIYNLLSQGTSPDADSQLSGYGLGWAATVSGSVATVVSFGADGPAAAGGFSLTSDAASTMAALGLTSKGGTLSYVVNGNTIIAYVNNVGGAGFDLLDRPVFSLELNASTGEFVYKQYDQLDHADGNGENTDLKSGSTTVEGINFGAIINATDGDGDVVNLDGKLTVKVVDDVPQVSIRTDETVTIDETVNKQNDDTTNPAVANLFAGVANKGSDVDMPSAIYAKDDVVDTSYDRGADDNAKTSLTLRIDSTDSGLTTTDGQPITLSLENGIVVGRVPGVDGAQGKAAFAITINADGEVSIAQYMSIKHPDTASTDEGVNLSGKISAVFSVTDYDKDTVTQSVSIGDKIVFEDDAPVQKAPATTGLTLNEDDLVGGNDDGPSKESLTASGNLNVALGADGGSIALSADNATWNGETKTLEANDHSWKVTLGNNGAYTFELLDNTLAHGPANNGQNVLNITIGYTATDGDSDVLTGSFVVKIEDDVPVTVAGQTENRLIDEDDIDTTGALGNFPNDGNGDGSYTGAPGVDNGGPASITGSLAHLVNAGADGPLAFSFTSDAASILQAQGLTSEGKALSYEVKGNVLYGYDNTDGTAGYAAGDRVVFKLTLNADGSYKFELVDQLDHTAPATVGTSAENLLTINLGAALQATDGDGDSVKLTGLVNFEVKDDVPVQTAPATTGLTLNEDDLVGGNDEAAPKESLTASGNLNVALGADGGSIALSADNATWNGQTKTLEANDHSWKVTLGNNGAYTFELLDNTLAHGPANNGQNVLNITIGYTATDGDSDVLTGSFVVKIEDDVPVAIGETATVRESAPASGNNLIFAFDVSGSMSDGVTDSNSPSRLQVAKDAAINIINASNAAMVLIVTFQDNAQASVWMTKADALTYIQNSIPNPNGGTDYDDAIDAIKGVPLVGGTTNVYFFSDGEVTGNDKLTGNDRAAWEAYLTQNGIKAYAVGVGNDINTQDEDLRDVAYPGEPIIITSATDTTLLATAPVTADLSTASGNVISNDSFGADGGRIQSITVGGVTYTWDGANTITVSTGGTITGSSLVNQTTTLGGKLSFDFATGHWSYTGPAELVTNTNETVTYTLVDLDGDTATASLVIGVQAVNDAPVNTVPSSLAVLEDQLTSLSGVSVGDVDANGGDITVKLEVAHGKLVVDAVNGLTIGNNGTATVTLTGTVQEVNQALAALKYQGSLNFNGTDQLKITTTDNGNTGIGGAKTDTDTVNITVTAVNDAPVLTPDVRSITFTENGSAKNLFGNVEIDDVDNPSNFSGGKVTLSLGGTAVSGDQLVLNSSWVQVSGNSVYVYDSGWKQIGTIASGAFGQTSIVINLNSNATEDRVEQLLEAVAFQSTSEDPTSATRTVTVTFDDGAGTANGGVSTDSSTITVNVVPVNDAPVFSNDTYGEREFSVNENTTSVGSVSATDVDGGALTYSILNSYGTDYAKFTIDPNTGAISFKSAPNYEDPQDIGGSDYNNRYEIDVQVSDGKGGTDIQRVEVVVNDVNEAPVLLPVTNTVSYTEQNTAVSLMPSGSVSDPDSPSNFQGGSVSVTLGGTAQTGDQLVLLAGSGATVSGNTVYVGGVSIGTVSGLGTSTVTVTFDNDATDSRVETLLKAIGFQNTTDDPTNAVRTATVTFNDGGNDGSGGALTDSSTITINVTPVNDGPTLSGVGGTLAYVEGDGAKVIDSDVTVADVDNATLASATVKITTGFAGAQDVLSFTNTNSTTFGNITASYNTADGTLTLTSPGATATKAQLEAALEAVTYQNTSENPSNTNRIVTYTVNDGAASSNAGTATITVTPVNDAPDSAAKSVSGDEDTTISVTLSGSDVDGTVAGYVIKTLPSNGTLYSDAGLTTAIASGATVTNATVYFKPAADYNGPASFTYAAKDNLGLEDSTPATVSITVNPVNDAPVITSPAAVSVAENIATSTVVYTATATDVDSPTITYSLSGTDASKFDINAGTGAVTFKSSPDYEAPTDNGANNVYNFTVVASDGTASTTKDVAVTVTNVVEVVNQAPTDIIWNAVVPGSNLPGNGTVIATLSTVDPDNTGGYTYELRAGTSAGFQLSSNGVLTAVDGLNNDQQYTIVVRVTDGLGAVYEETFNIITGNGNGDTLGVGGFGNSVMAGDDVLYGFNNGDVINGGAGNDTLFGQDGVDNLTGGAGQDSLFGGDGNDRLNGDQNDVILDGGTGNDVLYVDGGFTSSSDGQIVNVESVILNTSGILNLSNQTENLFMSGSSGADTMTGGSGNDTLAGNDGIDILIGGSGNDTLQGGAGADTLTGGSGTDRFEIGAGDSTPVTSGSAGSSNGTVSGFDVITDWGVGGTADKLVLPASVSQASTGLRDGSDSSLTVNGDTVESHSVNSGTGIAVFYGTDGGSNQLSITTTGGLAAVVQYLMATDIGTAGATLAFTGMGNTYVYQQTTSSSGGTLVQLTGVTLTDIYTSGGLVSAIDPIVLDLDHNGFAFSSVENGVSFDIDADGHKDQVAWTSDDGILAYDVNGDGKIDNGSEIFTPSFNGGTYASGVAALASLDSNGDGKIDAHDAAFDKLTVWVDANNNGISDEGELSSLTDHHVASISLTTDTTGGTEDGQTIFGEGSFTFDDGSTGSFVEVGFDTIFGSDTSDALTVIGTDGDDVLHGGMGQVFLTGGEGADTFVFDETALSDLDVADVITDFSSDQGDQLDVSALLDSLLGEQLTAETAASHLKATVVGNDTTVSVQTGADTWKDVAVLQNHTEAVKILFDDHQSVTVHHD